MKLHALQYLRALAALVVVYSHACIQVPAYRAQLMEFGSFGVDIFFVISGFIMMYITKEHHKPGAFMLNRIARVAPMYWLFTLLMASLILVVPTVFNNAELHIDALIKSLLFIPHFSNAHPAEVWPIVPPGWSLNFEMYFYLVFALSLMLKMRHRLLFVTAVITTVFIVAKLISTGGGLNSFFADNIVFEFLLGMLLAHAWRSGLRIPPNFAVLLFVAGCAMILLHSQLLLFAAYDLPGALTNGIPALMIVAGCVYMVVPKNELMLLLGDASYALYLSHIFVLGLLRKVLPDLLGDSFIAALVFVFSSMLVCLLISVLVHKYVDNWLLRRERLGSFGLMKRRVA